MFRYIQLMKIKARDKALFQKSDAGFTLIELLIVIIILGILAGTVISQISGARTAAISKTCKSDAADLRSAIDNFYLDSGAYPKATGTNTNYIPADLTATNTINGVNFTVVPGYLRSPGPTLIGDATLTKEYYLKVSITQASTVVSAVGTIQGYSDSAGTKIITDCVIQ